MFWTSLLNWKRKGIKCYPRKHLSLQSFDFSILDAKKNLECVVKMMSFSFMIQESRHVYYFKSHNFKPQTPWIEKKGYKVLLSEQKSTKIEKKKQNHFCEGHANIFIYIFTRRKENLEVSFFYLDISITSTSRSNGRHLQNYSLWHFERHKGNFYIVWFFF